MADGTEPDPDVREVTRVDVVEALARADFDWLLGATEGPQIDFKRQPYDLNTQRGKRDLVADVAAFANVQGGVIVIGVETTKHADLQVEFASGVVNVDPVLIPEPRVHDIVRSHCHPPPVALAVRTYQRDGGRGGSITLVAIHVETQPPDHAPMIVDRLIDENDAKVSYAVGWPRRYGSDTYWEAPARLQQLVAAGLRSPTTQPLPAAKVPDVLGFASEHEEWNEWGHYRVAAEPTGGSEIPDFFGQFQQLFAQHRGLRRHGFDLQLDWQVIQPVGVALASVGPRVCTVVTRSGAVESVALVSPDFLGWGTKSAAPGAARVEVNSIAFAEFTAETLRVAYELVGPRVQRSRWRVNVRLDHLVDRGPVAYRSNPRNWLASSPRARQNTFADAFDGTGAWRRDSYTAVARAIGAFGLGKDTLWFAEDELIDPARFETL